MYKINLSVSYKDNSYKSMENNNKDNSYKHNNSTLQIFFILSNKKTYNLLYLLYSISANKSLQKQEIVCHAYFTTETILLTSFFGSFGIIFRMPQCHLRKICSCWSFPCWPWILSAPSGLHGCI